MCVFSCLVYALSRSIPATECRNSIRGVGKHVANHVQTRKALLRSDVSRPCHRKLQEKDWQIQTTPSHSDNYLQSRPEGQTLGDGMTVIYTKLHWSLSLSLTGTVTFDILNHFSESIDSSEQFRHMYWFKQLFTYLVLMYSFFAFVTVYIYH